MPVLSTTDFSETTEELGSRQRAQSSRLTRNRRAQRRTWGGTLTFAAPADARMLEGLVDGLGHQWNFDDSTLSSLGLGSNSLTGITFSTTSPPPKYGTHRVQVASAGTIEFTLPGYSEYTVEVWKNDTTNGANWIHFATSFNGSSAIESQAGSTVSSVISQWFQLNAGQNFRLRGINNSGSNAAVRYDQLLIYPFAMTQPRLNALTSYDAEYPGLPFLLAAGEAMRGRGARAVLGSRSSEQYEQCWINGVFHPEAVRIPFDLEER
jgi:hypothetical protein